MSLLPGARFGPYEIVAAAGAGGMGEVYRARDTRLDRTVAIKVLPAEFAGDPQLRERFDREARAVSALNHPHICALYDIGADADRPFLVLEFLDGQTLAERIAGGPIAVDEALRLAMQVCDALDRAHRAGIVHRDLKPANVMITKAGAKLLDFGLAKTAAPVVAVSGLSMMPTTPHGVTAQGTILGTFQYMAPEQIEGLEADARTDIFAFGALLFEMLTGRTAFEGKTRASLLGAILKDEPPRVSAVQPLAPNALDRIIATCFAKDPDDRWQSMRDILHELTWIASGGAEARASEAGRHAPRPSSRAGWAVAGVTGLALAAAAVIAVRHLREASPPAEAIQFTIPAPDNLQFGGPSAGGTGTATQVAVSPDGRDVVFVAGGPGGFQLWLRPVGALVSRPIPGTEDGAFPFWSPDSRFIGFFAAGKLKKVPLPGGPVTVLCDGHGFGATWNRDNVIVFSPSNASALQRVSGAGGVPAAASVIDTTNGETSHRWPHFLPDGRHFIYTASTGACCPPVKPAVIRIGTLDSMDAVTLFQVESAVTYGSGHVLFVTPSGTLMAQRFDPEARQLKGDGFPLAEQVGSEGSRYASFSVSANGALVYARGATTATKRLTWFDRAGKPTGTVGEPAPYLGLALSPDERRVAVSLSTGTPQNRDIWVIDSARGTMSRLTFDPGDDLAPVWSPDGSRVAFQGTGRQNGLTLRQKLVTGTADEEPLSPERGSFQPTDWSSDGRFIAYTNISGSSSDVWILPLSGDKKPFPFAQTRFAETNAVFAPDGRWIAYQSNETGQDQVYVQPFPPAGGKYQVSQHGGYQPQWRGDGKELFFIAPETAAIMAAAIDTTRQFQAAVPERLFAISIDARAGRLYAVSKDGRRFLVNAFEQRSIAAPLTVVVNWLSAVQR